MESYFNINISQLKKSEPSLCKRIEDSDPDSSITVIDAKDGNKVPEIERGNRKVVVHSRFAPEKEAERMISEIRADQFDLFIIFGFGFAYHIEELLKRIGRDTYVLILEKSVSIIREAMVHRNLRNLIADKRIKILVDSDKDDISSALEGKSSYRVTFITHRGSFQLDPEYYNNLRQISISYLSAKEVNIATLARFEKSWAANIARNIQQIVTFPGAKIFYDRFKNIPAIVISAGPSLSMSYDFIKRNADKAVLISVDTSYTLLRKHGIEPHFCISVDPQLLNARYFEDYNKGSTVLVADPTAHPSIFRLFKGRRVLTGMVFQMMKWIENISGDKGELAYGGSVSTNAYDFAKRLGASPVIMVGQDLAFTGLLAHARGSYLDEQIHLTTSRFNNGEMFNRRQLTALPGIFVKGIQRNIVQTNQKMMIFLSWFEKRNDASLVNASCDGALMPNVKHCSFDEIELNDLDENIFTEIGRIYKENALMSDEKNRICDELLESAGEMNRELEALVPVIRRAVGFSEELIALIQSKKKNGKLEYLLKKLAETDKVIESKNALKDMIGFTIQRVIHTITEGYEIDEHENQLNDEERIAKRSHFLYSGLLEGSLFNKKVLNQMIFLLRKFE